MEKKPISYKAKLETKTIIEKENITLQHNI